MQHYFDTVLDRAGNVIGGAIITVKDHATGNLVTVYNNSNGTSPINIILTDTNGSFDFYIPNGNYDIIVSKNGAILNTKIDVPIGLFVQTIISPQVGIAVQNSPYITTSMTLPDGVNSLSVGPITLSPGVVVTVLPTSRWVIA